MDRKHPFRPGIHRWEHREWAACLPAAYRFVNQVFQTFRRFTRIREDSSPLRDLVLTEFGASGLYPAGKHATLGWTWERK